MSSTIGRMPSVAAPMPGADERGLGDRRVDDPLRPELVEQAAGGTEDAAVGRDVLSHHEHRWVALHLLADRLGDGLGGGELPLGGHCRHRSSPLTRRRRPAPTRAPAPGWPWRTRSPASTRASADAAISAAAVVVEHTQLLQASRVLGDGITLVERVELGASVGLGVAFEVAPEPHRVHLQQARTLPGPRPGHRLAAGLVDRLDVVALDAHAGDAVAGGTLRVRRDGGGASTEARRSPSRCPR